MPTITPKQAFDALKVLYPDTVGITKTGDPKTVQLLPPNDTPAYARMKFFAAVEIDWGTQTQYPTAVYRDATPQDAIDGVTAEFSNSPNFRTIETGELAGWVSDRKDTWWYLFQGLDRGANAYRYCRIPVPAPEPKPPEGWEIITQEHQKCWNTNTVGFCDILTSGGRLAERCFWAEDKCNNCWKWREYGVEFIDDPKYIRKAQY